ncbi:MAG: hypothetical protein M3Q53_03610 [Actinomycetota bacterium]|nr:hypothetical protein [Actinomycetota bacterium]
MRQTNNRRGRAVYRIADGMDLTIDLMTLGQYGLEREPADDAGSEECGPKRTDWEALRPARRRGACERDWRVNAPAWTAFACA